MLPKIIKSKKTNEQIRSLIKDKKAKLADNYGHRMYHCPRCCRLSGKFYFKLVYEGGSYEVEYKCSSCKTELEPVSNESGSHSDEVPELEKYRCPKCGKHSLYEDESYITM